MFLNTFPGTSQYDFSKEEPMDIQFSLDDFKAEGIDLHQLIKVIQRIKDVLLCYYGKNIVRPKLYVYRKITVTRFINIGKL